MTLDLIVPHYDEPWETCKYLFDSIAMQRGVDFSNIKVIVVNDGDNCAIDERHEEYFKNCPYCAIGHTMPHGGVSAARNKGLELSDADYVMFCDCDDGFLNNYGLHLVFSAMQEGFDYLYSDFVEETYTEKNIQTITRHKSDLTFMHGKVYRREFLLEHNLLFDPDMTLHEDGYYNMLVYIVAKNKGKLKHIETPFYLWCWNENSTVRKNKEDFVLKTYPDVMKTRIGLCEQLQHREYKEEFETAVIMTVLNSYYDFQKTSYHVAKNEKYLRKAEKAFKGFYDKFGKAFKNATNLRIAEIAQTARANACNNGMLMEEQDLRSFLRHIENDVKA